VIDSNLTEEDEVEAKGGLDVADSGDFFVAIIWAPFVERTESG